MKLKLLGSCLVVAFTAGAVYSGCKKKPEEPPATKDPASKQDTPTPKAGGAATPAAAPASSDGYTGGAVTGGGKITGTITYTGSEKDKTVTITKDKKTCCTQCTAGARPAHSLVVKDKKLANAVVYIDGITKGKPLDAKPITIDNKDCAFHPHVQIGFKGSQIAAKNSDPVLHNTHLFLQKGTSAKDLVNIALPNQGQSVSKKLKKGGIIKITCDAHEWMLAYVFSATTPYAVVTGEDGSFTLDQVPAGEYTVKVWHERLGEKELKVKVTAGGDAKADFAFN